MIIVLNGYPGVGKLTIGKELMAKMSARLLDIHTLYNLAFALTDFNSQEFVQTIERTEDLAHDLILQLPADQSVILTTVHTYQVDKSDNDRIQREWQRIQSLADKRGGLSVVHIHCDLDENIKRITSEGRGAKRKPTDADMAKRNQRDGQQLLGHDAKNLMNLDVTHLSAVEAAQAIFEWCQTLQNASDADGRVETSYLQFEPKDQYFQSTHSMGIKRLPSFIKGQHQVPKFYSGHGEELVLELSEKEIAREIEDLANQTRKIFGIRSKDLEIETDMLTTKHFCFIVEAVQDEDDASRACFIRKLEILDVGASVVDKLDKLLGSTFDEFAIAYSDMQQDFDDIVDFLEDFEEEERGKLSAFPSQERIEFATNDGTMLVFDMRAEKILIKAIGGKSCGELLALVSTYRLASDAESGRLHENEH
jgi:adenylate kinase family enzyme